MNSKTLAENIISAINSDTAVSNYDNAGALNTLRCITREHKKLDVKIYTSKRDNTPRLWIESRNVAPFSVIINEKSLTEILRYMITGEVLKDDIDPEDYAPLNEGENIAVSLLKTFIEAAVTIQFVPLFRTNDSYISAVINLRFGRISLKVPRTSESYKKTIKNYAKNSNQNFQKGQR